MAKSCIGGERVWFSMGLCSEYLFHSHVNLSSGIAVWQLPMLSCFWAMGVYLYCG